jgi:Thioredoxin
MLADSLASDLSVQIVRVDATKNDIIHPKVRINAFPTFYFFSVGDQDEPIEYDGERTLEAILKFIKAFKSSAVTKAAAAAVTAGIATGTATAAAEILNQIESSPSLIQGDRSHSKIDSTSASANESEGDSDHSSDEGEVAMTGLDEDMSGDSVSDAEPHAL